MPKFTFPGVHWHDGHTETVVFRMNVDDEPVRCRVSREALTDHLGAGAGDDNGLVACYVANIDVIHAIAVELYKAGEFDPDDLSAIFVQSRHLAGRVGHRTP